MRGLHLGLTLAVLLVACGASQLPEVLHDVVVPGEYSTGAGVLANLGQPCSREGDPGGVEVWHYCAEECEEMERQWCRARCEGACTGQWHFHLLNGLVLDIENPPPLLP